MITARNRRYDWDTRAVGKSFVVVLHPDVSAYEGKNSVRASFAYWRKQNPRRSGLAVKIARTPYAGPLSSGRSATALVITIVTDPRRPQSALPADWQPPADAMASVRARRAERAGIVVVDRRRRYDWQAVHGHTITVASHWRYHHRTADKIRAAWHAWKRSRQDAGAWDIAEAACWRIRLEPADESIAVTVVDTRQSAVAPVRVDQPAPAVAAPPAPVASVAQPSPDPMDDW